MIDKEYACNVVTEIVLQNIDVKLPVDTKELATTVMELYLKTHEAAEKAFDEGQSPSKYDTQGLITL